VRGVASNASLDVLGDWAAIRGLGIRALFSVA
jgi:hypothetical protein